MDLREVPSSTGRPSRRERVEAAQDLDVVVGGLSEADARVDDEVRLRHAGRHRPVERRAQVGDDLADDVAVVARLGSVVHHDQRHAGGGRHGSHRAAARPGAPHVVEQVRAGGEGGLGDGRLGRVDADGDAGQGRGHGRDDRHDPGDLLGRVDGRVAGSRRFAADVEQVGALGDHLAGASPPRCATGSASARRPSPENESGVTLRMPMT